MKELYSHELDLPNGEKVKVFLKKLNAEEAEEADFTYSQKYNQLLHRQFLSRAMMDKKFNDIGGLYSEKKITDITNAVEKLVDAQRIIEFFEGAEDISDEQKKELKEARETYLNIQYNMRNMDRNVDEMYSHSAESKAENHVIKWIVLNHTYYYEKVLKDGEQKFEAFPIFDGGTFDEKLKSYNEFLDDIDESDTPELSKKKQIAEMSLIRLSRIANLWYTGNGRTQEELDEAYDSFWPKTEEKEEGVESEEDIVSQDSQVEEQETPKKTPAKKRTAKKKVANE